MRKTPRGWIQIGESRTRGVARIPLGLKPSRDSRATSQRDSPIWIQPLGVFRYTTLWFGTHRLLRISLRCICSNLDLKRQTITELNGLRVNTFKGKLAHYQRELWEFLLLKLAIKNIICIFPGDAWRMEWKCATSIHICFPYYRSLHPGKCADCKGWFAYEIWCAGMFRPDRNSSAR